MAENGSPVETLGKKPPYVAFDTLASFIQRLKANEAVPPQIDRSMMVNLSGAVQSHLLATLRFLRLVDASKGDAVNQPLRDLVEAHGTGNYGAILFEVFDAAYKDIIGDIDIGTATAKQIDEVFSAQKLDGTMLDRAVRFYLKGMSLGGAKISPYLAKRKSRGGTTGKGKKTKSPQAENGSGTPAAAATAAEGKPPAAPKNTRPYPLYFKGGREGVLHVPTDLTLADCKVIELQLAVLKAYAGDDNGG